MAKMVRMKKFRSSNIGAPETRRKHLSKLFETARRDRRRNHPRRRLGCSLARVSACAAAMLLLSLASASAAESPPDNPLQPFLDGLAGKYGWMTTVILVIGSLRILFKPVMLAIESYVKQTPSESDDARLAKFEGGFIYKTIAFALDFGASIKLPLIKPPTDPINKG
jgi:hypothetical protein